MADQQQNAEESCPGYVAATTVAYNDTPTSPGYQGLNPVAWTYVISGTITLVSGLLVLFLVAGRTEQKLLTDRAVEKESRPQEPLLDVIWFFVPVVCFYFTVVGLEVTYQSYIYSIALCSQLHLSVSRARVRIPAPVELIFFTGAFATPRMIVEIEYCG